MTLIRLGTELALDGKRSRTAIINQLTKIIDELNEGVLK